LLEGLDEYINTNLNSNNFFCLIKMWRQSGIGYQPHNQLNWFRLGYESYLIMTISNTYYIFQWYLYPYRHIN